MNIPDKTHADWLLTTQECLIKSRHPSLSTKIEHFPEYDKRFLTIQQIPLSVFTELMFIVNTDQNNNYLYIAINSRSKTFSSYHRIKYFYCYGFQNSFFINQLSFYYDFYFEIKFIS